MVKAYLRYDLASTFGVVTSNSNIVYGQTGKLVITASLEDVSVWNVKQGALVSKLLCRLVKPCMRVISSFRGVCVMLRLVSCLLVQIKTLHTPANSGKAPAEVTQIAVGRSDSHQIAVGHADGTVSIFHLQVMLLVTSAP